MKQEKNAEVQRTEEAVTARLLCLFVCLRAHMPPAIKSLYHNHIYIMRNTVYIQDTVGLYCVSVSTVCSWCMCVVCVLVSRRCKCNRCKSGSIRNFRYAWLRFNVFNVRAYLLLVDVWCKFTITLSPPSLPIITTAHAHIHTR